VTATRIDQDMAAAAAAMLPPKVDKELRTRYRQLRMMLHNAGLAATYAYIAAKSNDPSATGHPQRAPLPAAYRLVAEGIRTRLGRLGLLDGDPANASHSHVLKRLGEIDTAVYLRASTEITQLAGWLSRLADAMYQPEQTTGDEPGAAAEPPT
jgi:CRISPR/Cas system CMR-associated protein Cmr5 small subunit